MIWREMIERTQSANKPDSAIPQKKNSIDQLLLSNVWFNIDHIIYEML